MKETRFFYAPNAATATELPEDEATHAMRVVRLKSGDEMMLIDGRGGLYRAEVTTTAPHHCCYHIVESMPQKPQWQGHFHLAIAPTKMIDRMEWLLEKATEIGFDEVSLLDCKFSERKTVKPERLERIIVAAAKQSHKAWLPKLNPMVAFKDFVAAHPEGHRYIAHCYDEYAKVDLFDQLRSLPPTEDATVLIGPEGDFSTDEVEMAMANGFTSVSLGSSRLRTETAGLAAVMMFQLARATQEQR